MSTSAALYSNATLKASNAQPYTSMEGKLDPMLLLALKDMKFEYMTPVQSKVLGEMPTLKSDCLVQAKTGTGKTLAFLLAAIQNSITELPRKGQVSILIISPTRELALQIAAEASQVVARLRTPLEVHTAFGGTAKASSLNKFIRGDPKILVATPGRLNDYLQEDDVRVRFKGMKTLVLDEADRMLDQGFLPDVLKVLRALPPKASQWQGMCFSATIPTKMHQVLSHVLNKNHVSISTIDTSEPPTLMKVPQYSVIMPRVEDTFVTLFSLIQEEVSVTEGESKIIVFGTTANLVALYSELYTNQTELKVYELHSRMSQPARTKTTDAFKTAKSGIMFASDVVGRGMDFPDVSLVLQVGLPADADSYTHRVGRTARAGKDGRAIILLTQAESFFLKVHRQFPIETYPATDKILNDSKSADIMTKALQYIDPKSKQKAYSAYLGFMKGFMNKMRMNAADLVKLANDFALKGMLSGEVPEMEKKTIGKMGLKGTPGIRYAPPSIDPPSHKRGPPPPERSTEDGGTSRRLRHQGVPDFTQTTTNARAQQGQDRGIYESRTNRDPTKSHSGARGGGSGRRGGQGHRNGRGNVSRRGDRPIAASNVVG